MTASTRPARHPAGARPAYGPHEHLLAPGDYLLFALGPAGVPSVARTVRVG